MDLNEKLIEEYKKDITAVLRVLAIMASSEGCDTVEIKFYLDRMLINAAITFEVVDHE